MAPTDVILHSAFDPARIRFGAFDAKSKKKMVPISYDAPDGPRRRVMIQTPAVALPFGVSEYEEMGVVQSYSLDFSFRNYDTDTRMSAFLEKMRAFETVLLDAGVSNSVEWFGKKMSRELVTEFCKKFVRDPKDPKYAPTMRAKIPMVDGSPTAEFYDENKAAVGMDYITKGTVVRMIIELSAVWFMGGKSYGVTWRVRQVRVVSKPGRLEGYSFFEEDDEDAAGAGGGGEHVDLIEDDD